MIGAILGDIIGSPYEFENHKNKDFPLFSKKSRLTDDSIMTLAIGKAMMETQREVPLEEGMDYTFIQKLQKNAIFYMQTFGRKYPNCGFGHGFYTWIFSEQPKPYNSFGNGAAMRISPIGFFAKSEKEVRLLSKAVTEVTHNHLEGLKGAEAIAMCIFAGCQGKTKAEIKEIARKYYKMDFTIDEIRPRYGFSPTCQDTVPQSIQCFLESKNFEDAIRIAISLGGDSDTIGAITGSIAQSYYGVPKELEEKGLEYLDKDLKVIYMEWKNTILERKG
ncbi:MAG: ADP-ribosylglycohydrolase family protein [Tissierellia bacterium]|nr:ADP-ribosylglycohydrolase family protein [Tissierellia bacterium]